MRTMLTLTEAAHLLVRGAGASEDEHYSSDEERDEANGGEGLQLDSVITTRNMTQPVGVVSMAAQQMAHMALPMEQGVILDESIQGFCLVYLVSTEGHLTVWLPQQEVDQKHLAQYRNVFGDWPFRAGTDLAVQLACLNQFPQQCRYSSEYLVGKLVVPMDLSPPRDVGVVPVAAIVGRSKAG